MHPVRVAFIPLALLTSLLGACTEEPFLATADLSVQANEDVAARLQYPLLLEFGFSPDSVGDRTMGAVGETTPELWMLCEAPEDDWSVQTQLHQQLTGNCEEIDPHVVVRALSINVSSDCQTGSDVTVDPDAGTEIAYALAPVFAELDGCGTYRDTVTLDLQVVN